MQLGLLHVLYVVPHKIKSFFISACCGSRFFLAPDFNAAFSRCFPEHKHESIINAGLLFF